VACPEFFLGGGSHCLKFNQVYYIGGHWGGAIAPASHFTFDCYSPPKNLTKCLPMVYYQKEKKSTNYLMFLI